MSSPSSQQVADLKSKYAKAGQEHVFKFWDTLSRSEQSTFFSQLSSIDPEHVNKIAKKAISAAAAADSSTTQEKIEPPSEEASASLLSGAGKAKEAEWRKIGLEAIAKGQVAILLMAGGQGTRLGSSAPKGCYDIGLPSKKSLFQLQAERIARLEVIAEKEAGSGGGKVTIPWYVMTSGPTRKPTEDFFRENKFFGLKEENVIFFEQGVLPCLTQDGKFFLDTKSSLSVAPDGNGGVYAALRAPLRAGSTETVLSSLTSRKAQYIHAYCVDNCLVRVGDPTFLGYSISTQSICGAKVVRKENPSESVGVVALRDGKWGVVEYSEIPKELSEKRVGGKSDGELVFRAANIANHFYTTDFLRSIEKFEGDMAYHVANKKIPHTDLGSGEYVKPSKPNGIKMELFIFDVFPFVPSTSFSLFEVARSDDFSPLKNAPGTGSDDPETSRRDLLNANRRWLRDAGAEVGDDVDVELSPKVSYAGEGLEVVKGKKVGKNGLVEKVEDLEKLFA